MDTLQNVYLTGAAYSVSLSTAPVVGPAFLRTFFPKLIKLISIFNLLKKESQLTLYNKFHSLFQHHMDHWERLQH